MKTGDIITDTEAFPIVLSNEDYSNGLTKREYASIRILSALLSNSKGHELVNIQSDDAVAEKYIDYSIRLTDELFKKLES